MTPSQQLVLRPEFATDPAAIGLLGQPQQGGSAPEIREDEGGAVGPQGGSETPGGPEGPKQQPGIGDACLNPTNLVMFGGMFLVLYFFVIRPQKKQEQARQALLASLKKGDKVVMNSGIHGQVVAVDEQTVRVQVDTVEMVVDKSAIGRIQRGDGVVAKG